MSSKTVVITISSILALSLFIAGCGEPQNMTLNFEPESTATYQYEEENIKQVKFERPSEDTVSDKVTKSTYTIVYDQKTVNVSETGSMLAEIEIKRIAYSSQSPKRPMETFDSDQNSGEGMAKLIGQKYNISISPMGKAELVKPVNISSVKGSARQRAQRLFSKEQVEKRHTIEPLAKKPGNVDLKPGASWSINEPSPKGMMNSKNYEKIYKFKKIDNGNAVIEMDTIPAEGQASGGMFAMFGDEIQADFNDTYNGLLKYSVETGQIKKYTENLDAVWTAIDNSKQDEFPDTLTIRFAKKFTLKTID